MSVSAPDRSLLSLLRWCVTDTHLPLVHWLKQILVDKYLNTTEIIN